MVKNYCLRSVYLTPSLKKTKGFERYFLNPPRELAPNHLLPPHNLLKCLSLSISIIELFAFFYSNSPSLSRFAFFYSQKKKHTHKPPSLSPSPTTTPSDHHLHLFETKFTGELRKNIYAPSSQTIKVKTLNILMDFHIVDLSF